MPNNRALLVLLLLLLFCLFFKQSPADLFYFVFVDVCILLAAISLALHGFSFDHGGHRPRCIVKCLCTA